MFLSSYRNTRKSLGELEKAVETLAYCSCSHSISRSPKPLLAFLKLLNYNGSWERFFRWSPLYGVSYSFVGYPHDYVYSIFLSHFFFLSFYSLYLFLFFLFFFFFSLTYITYIVTTFYYRIHFFYAIKS